MGAPSVRRTDVGARKGTKEKNWFAALALLELVRLYVLYVMGSSVMFAKLCMPLGLHTLSWLVHQQRRAVVSLRRATGCAPEWARICIGTGLGDCVFFSDLCYHIGGFLNYRKFAVDWRNSMYLGPKDKELNLFALLFDSSEYRTSLRAFDTYATEHANAAEVPFVEPRMLWHGWLGSAGSFSRGSLIPWTIYFCTSPSGKPAAGMGGLEVKDRIWGSQIPPLYVYEIEAHRAVRHELGGFSCNLSLKAPYMRIVLDFHKQRLARRKTVAVHVRHGNGEAGQFSANNRALPLQLSDFVRNLHYGTVVPEAERYLGIGEDFQVFVCSDSGALLEAYQRLDPDRVVVREQTRPAEGSGAFIFGAGGIANPVDLAADAAVDMHLLGHCDGFVALTFSFFTYLPSKLSLRRGKCVRQVSLRMHTGGRSPLADLDGECL